MSSMVRVWRGGIWAAVLAMAAGPRGQEPLGSAGTCDTCDRVFVHDSLHPGQTRCPYCNSLLRPTTRDELRARLRGDPPSPTDDAGR